MYQNIFVYIIVQMVALQDTTWELIQILIQIVGAKKEILEHKRALKNQLPHEGGWRSYICARVLVLPALLSRVTYNVRVGCLLHGTPAMHAFRARMNQNCRGQRQIFFIGAELRLGDELDRPVILEHNILQTPIFRNTQHSTMYAINT